MKYIAKALLSKVTRFDVLMFAHDDGDRRSERQRETPSAVNADGVVALKS